MGLFVVLGLMTVAALALLLPPLLRRHGRAAPRHAYDLEIYRDQLRELDRDAERGLIGAGQHASARAEIERRMLGAARPDDAAHRAAPSIVTAFVVAIALPLVAGSLYLWLGSPGLEGQPFATREQPARPLAEGAERADIAALVEGLAKRLEAQPDDLEGWVMLGRSYGVLKRYDDAVVALRHALMVADGEPDVTAMLGEYQVFAAGGAVTPEAIATFETALERNPNQPAGRFYLGLARAQAGDMGAALDLWVALAKDSPADASWVPSLRERISETAMALGVEVPEVAAPAPGAEASGAELTGAEVTGAEVTGAEVTGAEGTAPGARAPGPTREDIESAARMSESERMEMIRGMVARLAERLEDNPDDAAGWERLARSYGTLGEAGRARDTFGRAAALDPDNPALLQAYGTAIVEAAPDGAPPPQEAVDVFRRLARIDGDNQAALWHLGLAAARTGNAAEARALWRRLLALLAPESPAHAAPSQAR